MDNTNKQYSISKYVSMIHRFGQIYFDEQFKQYNIGSGQYIFLFHLLFEKDGVRQEDLSNALNIDKGTTARAVKKLEVAGYVTRKIDENDYRVNRVYVTEKAMTIKKDLQKIIRGWTNIIEKGFTKEEKQLNKQFIERMADNVFVYRNGDDSHR